MLYKTHKTLIMLIFFLKTWIFENVELFAIFEIYFGIVGVLCIINCYFKCVYGIRCVFLYIWRYFEDMREHFLGIVRKMFQKCEQVSYEIFVWVLGGLFGGPKWSSLTPIPGVNVKVPFWGGKNIENTCLLLNYHDV